MKLFLLSTQPVSLDCDAKSSLHEATLGAILPSHHESTLDIEYSCLTYYVSIYYAMFVKYTNVTRNGQTIGYLSSERPCIAMAEWDIT